jgi:hypothetical protein
MRNLDRYGFRRAEAFALEQLMMVHEGSTDLRWALAALLLRSLSIVLAGCRGQLLTLARNAARRIASTAGFADHIAPAATTVAAGGH